MAGKENNQTTPMDCLPDLAHAESSSCKSIVGLTSLLAAGMFIAVSWFPDGQSHYGLFEKVSGDIAVYMTFSRHMHGICCRERVSRTVDGEGGHFQHLSYNLI